MKDSKEFVGAFVDLFPYSNPDISKECFDISFLDIAGPLCILDNDKVRKLYHLLVLRSRPRSCHIELFGSTSDVLKGFKCLFSRRSYPSQLIADHKRSCIRSSKKLRIYFSKRTNQMMLQNWILRGLKSNSVTAIVLSLKVCQKERKESKTWDNFNSAKNQSFLVSTYLVWSILW